MEPDDNAESNYNNENHKSSLDFDNQLEAENEA
jgi:hypothetical protein